MNVSAIKSTLQKFGQEHLLKFWNNLSEVEKEELCMDISEINLEQVVSFFKTATEDLNEEKEKLDDRMKALPSNLYGGVSRCSSEVLKSYEDEGFKQIAKGRVGVLLMAGGQGTRLGVKYPKGMYDIGLPSHKTLYQIQAERIRRLSQLSYERLGKPGIITWFIMTSEHTAAPTVEFFKKNSYFGLDKNNVIIFEQYLLPAFTFDGKIILENTHKISKSPDGNGGLYRALRDRKVLDEIERRGIKYLHAHSVDNILVKVADPVFIGYCVKKDAECGAKVVEKSSPSEAVGVVCTVDGKYQVVEYSEITNKTAERRDSNGKLTFSAGNICNHFFTAKFLRKVADKYEGQLKLHVAKKKIPFVDSEGNIVYPQKPNGIKIEKFVFDVFPFSDKLAVWEVNRTEEFSALKNADDAGKDCPSTARESIYALHRKYVENAGGCFERENGIVCEISPLLSYAGEGLKQIVANKIFKSPLLLKAEDEQVVTNGVGS